MRTFSRKAERDLEREVRIYGEDSWGRVTTRMRLRGYDVKPGECRRYWQNRQTGTRRQQMIWTFRDNQELARLYEEYGKNWCRYSEFFPLFTRKEIREHYENTIRGHREEYLAFDEDGQPDGDRSPDYRLRKRNMYCPTNFRLSTKQEFYRKFCKNKECLERGCIFESPNGTREVTCLRAYFKCKVCGKKLDAKSLTIDHIWPVAAKLNEILRKERHGGEAILKPQMADWYNDLRNLQPLCRSCNSRKGDKIY